MYRIIVIRKNRTTMKKRAIDTFLTVFYLITLIVCFTGIVSMILSIFTFWTQTYSVVSPLCPWWCRGIAICFGIGMFYYLFYKETPDIGVEVTREMTFVASFFAGLIGTWITLNGIMEVWEILK